MARLRDQGFVNYVSQFDIACLVETFVVAYDNLKDIFPAYDIFFAPAHKLTVQGRMSGGIALLVKKTCTRLLQENSYPASEHTVSTVIKNTVWF